MDVFSAHASGYDKPVLFMAGACDTWIGEPLQRKHVEMCPNASLAIIPDAGHDMFWDNPVEAVEAVRRFLERRAPSSAAGSIRGPGDGVGSRWQAISMHRHTRLKR
jgi:alpha-beta hydrolase superfamily lysophospholipase